MRSFLGLAAYYRRFVPGFARVAAPLYNLVGGSPKKTKKELKGGSFEWSPGADEAFTTLKELLTSPPILAYPRFGACLSQVGTDGQLHPVAYASRGLRGAEKNYSDFSSFKIELLALKWAVADKFREYLIGSKCTVLTDNNPLAYIQTAKLGATEQRWVSQLAPFDLTIKYRPGKQNRCADALSRCPDNEVNISGLAVKAEISIGSSVPSEMRSIVPCGAAEEVNSPYVFPSYSHEDLRQMQQADQSLKEVWKCWQSDWQAQDGTGLFSPEVRGWLKEKDKITEIQGVLYRQIMNAGKQSNQLLVPKVLKFNRMPQGLCNSPSTFQRLMELIFGDLNMSQLVLYLDDILVYSTTFDQHLDRLGNVFKRLIHHGLKLKGEKCHLFQAEVHHLGHIVNASGVSVDPGKIERVLNWPVPSNASEMRSFLGLAAYYRRFVPGFARVAAPLYNLVGGSPRKTKKELKGGSFEWSPGADEAFTTLKELLTSPPILAYPRFAYIQTAKLGATEQRWVSQLAPFDLTIKYRPGKQNRCADALSRCPDNEVNISGTSSESRNKYWFLCSFEMRLIVPCGAVEEVNSPYVFPSYSHEDLRQMQQADQSLKEVWKCWQSDWQAQDGTGLFSPEVRGWLKEKDKITEIQGVLYRQIMNAGSSLTNY
ncbi:putative transposon Ty3-I Gag-Pol polyprotein [Apostichopus japonicus]|uniref:Putative transposon Ty3-I Gag-Pol polyprotein n=1 Tax=Stichopus japonicus TaxID=307972 RepID=A0A2G8KY05_STIJA|nr:putative transposon Ty3-I Gag-Pol polyprotein [Apostichopus japonicus]